MAVKITHLKRIEIKNLWGVFAFTLAIQVN